MAQRNFFFPPSGQAVVTYIDDGIETQVVNDSVNPANNRPLPVAVTDISGTVSLATEATSQAILADTTALVAKDFATETTLAAAAADLALLEAKDFATETTLGAVATDVAAIEALAVTIEANTAVLTEPTRIVGLQTTYSTSLLVSPGTYVEPAGNASGHALVDVQSSALPTGAATETTLAAAAADLALLEAKDFATETTLDAVDTKLASVIKTDGIDTFLGIGGVTQAGVFHGIHVNQDGDVFVIEQGRTVVQTVRLSYAVTPVNTTTWQQLVASMPAQARRISVFDSSGQTMELGFGAALSETRALLIFPGGNGQEPLSVPNNTRVSVRAVSANATEGEIVINFFS